MNLKELHSTLQGQFEEIERLHEYGAMPIMSADTAYALGYALGCISKAEALVGRDIDQGM
jgi:hypothetical protein